MWVLFFIVSSSYCFDLGGMVTDKFKHLKNIHTIKAEAESRGKAILRNRNGYWSKGEYTPLDYIEPDLTLRPKYRSKTVSRGSSIYEYSEGLSMPQVYIDRSVRHNQFEQTPMDPWYGVPDMSKTVMPVHLRCNGYRDRRMMNDCVRNQHNTTFIPVMQYRGGY